MRDAAHRIRTAALDALQRNGIAPVKRYRAILPVQLPDVPIDADFDTPEWQHYQAAVDAARRHDAKAAQYAIMEGLKIKASRTPRIEAARRMPHPGCAVRLTCCCKAPKAGSQRNAPRCSPGAPRDVEAEQGTGEVEVGPGRRVGCPMLLLT
jgi:hypothetical protein